MPTWRTFNSGVDCRLEVLRLLLDDAAELDLRLFVDWFDDLFFLDALTDFDAVFVFA